MAESNLKIYSYNVIVIMTPKTS